VNFQQELQTALLAVRKASTLCASVQFSLITSDTLEKKDRSPVTIADFGSQAVVSSILADSFADDPLVGEEDSQDLEQNPDMLDKVFSLVREQIPGINKENMLHAIARGAVEPDYHGRYWTLDPRLFMPTAMWIQARHDLLNLLRARIRLIPCMQKFPQLWA